MEKTITDDLSSLLAVLPPEIATVIREINRSDALLEIILDLGRVPTARFIDGEYVLVDREVSAADIDLVTMQIGDFDADNRAGMERTLHRISAMRNRRGEVVGLTCRVGRAVHGTIDIIRDIIESGKGILFLGRPGVGKTTMLREAARVLAETRRVVIVDTSNEIGGDGDVAHPAVGKARRMQVSMPNLQHEVMIEAVENHNPQVIVIDEIGRELEAQAARTIAERGVQLIGTAHGLTLDNLLLNPTLSDLIGGIESVTLSDEEARRRGTQKTVLERRAPPTFEVLIEIQDRDTLLVHHDVATSVDMRLRGFEVTPEVRRRLPDGRIEIIQAPVIPGDAFRRDREDRLSSSSGRSGGKSARGGKGSKGSEPRERSESSSVREPRASARGAANGDQEDHRDEDSLSAAAVQPRSADKLRPIKVYAYAIARNRLIDAARNYNVPLEVTDVLQDADALLTLKNFYRRRPRLVADAEQRGMPIYVLRSNTLTQIEDFLIDLYDLQVSEDDPYSRAMRETAEAIEAVRSGTMDLIDLTPQQPSIRRRQHDLIREAKLASHSFGKEPNRHVRIYRG